MATIRRFCCNDLLGFASVNLDHFNFTNTLFNYLTWFAKWSDYCHVAIAPGNRIIGYIIGAADEQSKGEHWQGFVIDVNVASEYRRQRVATRLMRMVEKLLVEKMLVSPRDHDYFVCLFVGITNGPAKEMFGQLGYEVRRSMSEFMLDKEDALYMVKELSVDDELLQFYEVPEPLTEEEV